MPHMLIQTPLTLAEMMQRIEPGMTHANEAIRIKVINSYRNDNTLLFEVHIHETTIDQEIAVMLIGRETPNEYILKIGRIGNPRATAGTHFAVGRLGRLLVDLHPEATIIQNKVSLRYSSPPAPDTG